MAACWERRKKRKTNKVLRKGLHSASVPTELEHLCFSSPLRMLCKCQRLEFGMWAHRCLWSVYVGREPLGPLDIDILCKSVAAEADIISPSVLLSTDSGLLRHTRSNRPFHLWSETWVCAKLEFFLVGVILGYLALPGQCHRLMQWDNTKAWQAKRSIIYLISINRVCMWICRICWDGICSAGYLVTFFPFK